MTRKNISIAYSPDTDDQFMVLALKDKKIDWEDFEFTFIVDDIQKLNEAARVQKYDITAISVGAYPLLRSDYLLMPIGASIGDEFGPAIVTHPHSELKLDDLAGKRIAVPGINTSAHIAAQSLIGPFTPIPTYFMDIRDRVMDGSVDAGILIHELQLQPESQGLRKLSDLGRLWHDRFGLPLPLGANAIRRSLGAEDISRLSRIYRQSIEYALADRSASIARAVSQAAAKDTMDTVLGDRYISMYVNHRSLAFQDDVLCAIETLFSEGSQRALFAPLALAGNLSQE